MEEHRDFGGRRSPGTPASGPRRANWLGAGTVFYGLLAAVAWAWRSGFYDEPLFFVSREAADRGIAWLPDLALGVAAGLTVVALSAFSTAWTDWGERLADRMAELLAGLPFSHALGLALLSGFGEELLFRGALQPRVGWFAASLLFGLVHVGPGRDFLPWTVFAILAGGLFGGLFLATGNLVAPIVAHAVVNGINLPILARRGRELRAAELRPPVEPRGAGVPGGRG